MKTIQCQIKVNGEQKWFPLPLLVEDGKHFVIWKFSNPKIESLKIPLKKSRLVEPSEMDVTWNYKGTLLEIRSKA